MTFEVSKAKQFPGKDYDFVAVFDCLHDMGDPIGAAAHVTYRENYERLVAIKRKYDPNNFFRVNQNIQSDAVAKRSV